MLFEFFVKNGFECVVDDVRVYVLIIKMFWSFYYIDEKGKD